MDASSFIKRQLRTLHSQYDTVAGDLTDEQANHVPPGGHQSIAFCLWHYARTEDNIVRFVIQHQPTVWIEGGWDQRFGLDSKAQGTGMTDEQAAALTIKPIADFRRYMKDVWAASDEYIGSLSEAGLEQKVTVKPLGEMTLFDCLTNMCITHGFRHLGEVEYARGLFGLRGATI